MRSTVATMAATALVGVAACRDGPPTDPSAASSASLTLAKVSGDSQSGEAGRLLDQFLVFRVTDATGAPVSGLRVQW